MNIPAGPWYIDDTFTFTVTTHRFDTGALTDADAVPAYRVYEDETGTAILTGNMAKLDDTNTTGFYSEQLTLSAANGFEVGKSYSIYVTAAVNSVTGGQSGGFKVIATPVAQTGDSYAIVNSGTHGNAALKVLIDAIDDFLDTEVAAILADTNELQTDWVNGGRLDLLIDAIKAKTDSLTFTTANQVDATTVTISTGAVSAAALATDAVNEIADGILDRNMATGTDSGSTTVRTPRQALRAIRNKVAIATGTATIYKEDDATSSWTAAVTTTAGDPISAVDPAGP